MRRQQEPIFLYCQACSNKFLFDENLVEIKLNDIPGGIPYVDKEDGKVKMPPMQGRRRMFKCPKCGRGVASKMLTTPPKDPTIISDRKGYTNPMDPRS
jgi:DNA-directed RNA polymerase subunit M/transcription elongation factor TFIIS